MTKSEHWLKTAEIMLDSHDGYDYMFICHSRITQEMSEDLNTVFREDSDYPQDKTSPIGN